MKSLGIELKGSTCIGVLLDSSFKLLATLKLELSDSYNNEQVCDFAKQFETFVNEHSPDSIMIKKRQEKGKFAGGATSFKMEGLIQVSSKGLSAFASGSQLNAFQKKCQTELPNVKKYQAQALFCALYALDI